MKTQKTEVKVQEVIRLRAWNPKKKKFVKYSLVGNNKEGYAPMDYFTGELCEIRNYKKGKIKVK